MSPLIPQKGLEWSRGLFDITPKWTVEPSMSTALNLAKAHIPDSEAYKISFFASGAFNKLYLIEPDSSIGQSYLLRVTLPVDPYHKTASEVATLRCLAQHTSIPVPKVLAYSTSADNELGFEWILMTRMTGVALRTMWETPALKWEDRVRITETVAGWVEQMHRITSRALGSLFLAQEKHVGLPAWAPNDPQGLSKCPVLIQDSRTAEGSYHALHESPEYEIGPGVSPSFYYESRVHLCRSRGPFSSSAAWIAALIDIHIRAVEHLQERLSKEDDDDSGYDSDDIADLARQVEAAQSLLTLLPQFFPSSLDSKPETFVLHHTDISTNNILIDPETKLLTALVDWENVHFHPLWNATRAPQFLSGPTIDPGVHGSPIPLVPPPPDPDVTDDLKVELRDYMERQLLRPVYHRIVEISKEEEDRKKRVFLDKVEELDSPLCRVLGWATDVLNGGTALTAPEWGMSLFVWEDE